MEGRDALTALLSNVAARIPPPATPTAIHLFRPDVVSKFESAGHGV